MRRESQERHTLEQEYVHIAVEWVTVHARHEYHHHHDELRIEN